MAFNFKWLASVAAKRVGATQLCAHLNTRLSLEQMVKNGLSWHQVLLLALHSWLLTRLLTLSCFLRLSFGNWGVLRLWIWMVLWMSQLGDRWMLSALVMVDFQIVGCIHHASTAVDLLTIDSVLRDSIVKDSVVKGGSLEVGVWVSMVSWHVVLVPSWVVVRWCHIVVELLFFKDVADGTSELMSDGDIDLLNKIADTNVDLIISISIDFNLNLFLSVLLFHVLFLHLLVFLMFLVLLCFFQGLLADLVWDG